MISSLAWWWRPFLLYTIYQKWAFGNAMCALEECVKGNVSVKRYQLTRREHNKDINILPNIMYYTLDAFRWFTDKSDV